MKVTFFRTPGGNEPVLEWLRGLGANDRKTIGEDLRTLQLGWPVGMPLSRSLGAGLFELRSDLSGNRIARLVFFQHEQSLVVVEGFIKKTRATPDEVLTLSRKRKSEYQRAARDLKR